MRAILTYHSIDSSRSPISLAASSFRRHVEWLAQAEIRVTTVAELVRAPHAEDAVAITFDDGFLNFEQIAWPLLRDHGLPVTLFVATAHVGTTNAWGGFGEGTIPELPLLGWSSLSRLADEGVEIGSHSSSHRDLRQLDDAAMDEELVGSAERIRSETGRRPEVFAYPYGSWDRRVARAAKANYSFACTTELRPLHGHEELHLLPRLDAYYLRRAASLRRWGRPSLRFYLALRSCGRRLRQAREQPFSRPGGSR